jgi:peptidoglycan/LPS O-acetylase OafA/YrhL
MIQSRSVFRYDINALRVIAIVGVLLFHFKVPYFNGGFSGVDIFFVISGYLMTGIVFRGLNSGKFSILDFYRRRVLRIVPALLFLICSIIAICFFIYLPSAYQGIAKNAMASLVFISNMFYAIGNNYFAESFDTNIFLHTWSLSVEWQFYLILPVVMVIANRFLKNSKTKFLLLFAIASLLSFLAAMIATRINPTLSFYVLPTRAWEMLTGGIALLVEENVNSNIKRKLPIIGYIVLFGSVIFLNPNLNWPGAYTLIPVIGTFFVIIGNDNSFEILKSRLLLLLGKTSYSIYLWHWPVFVIATYFGFKSSFFVTISLIALSLLLGYLSFYFIETYSFKRSRIMIIATLTSVCLIGLLWKKPMNDGLFKKETVSISNYYQNDTKEHNDQFSKYVCYINTEGKDTATFKKKECLCVDHTKRNVILLGDSHAAHLSQSIRESLSALGIHLSQATSTGCFPIIRKNGMSECSDIIDYTYYNFLPKNAHEIDGVIISANWALIKDNERVKLIEDLTKTFEHLEKLDIRPILLGQTETYNISFPTIAAREYENKVSISSNYLSEASLSINAFLKENFKKYYIDIYDLGNVSKISNAGVPYMFDQNHFTKFGADQITKLILKDKIFNNFLIKLNVNRPKSLY